MFWTRIIQVCNIIILSVFISCNSSDEIPLVESAYTTTPYSPVAEEPAVPTPVVESKPTETVTKVTPTPTPTPALVSVSIQELILGLSNKDETMAIQSATRLIGRQEDVEKSVEALVTSFAFGDDVMKKRVIWCLRQMNEPVRVFFNKVRSNPHNWHPRVLIAIDEITVAINNSFYQSKLLDN
jgi:hypothetical protein